MISELMYDMGIIAILAFAGLIVIITPILVCEAIKRLVQAILAGLRAIRDWLKYQLFERRHVEKMFEPWCDTEEVYSEEYYAVDKK